MHFINIIAIYDSIRFIFSNLTTRSIIHNASIYIAFRGERIRW